MAVSLSALRTLRTLLPRHIIIAETNNVADIQLYFCDITIFRAAFLSVVPEVITAARIFFSTKIKKYELGGACSTHGEIRTYNIVAKISRDSKSFRRPRHKRKDKTGLILKQECVNLWTDFELVKNISRR
jgi:hypothetical protein